MLLAVKYSLYVLVDKSVGLPPQSLSAKTEDPRLAVRRRHRRLGWSALASSPTTTGTRSLRRVNEVHQKGAPVGRSRWTSSTLRGYGPVKIARRPVSRVLSAPCGVGRPFLWDAHCCAPHATNPGGGAGMHLVLACAAPAAPIRSCSRWGLPCRRRYRQRGALLPPRFTLALGAWLPRRVGRFVFCGTVPGVAPAGR